MEKNKKEKDQKKKMFLKLSIHAALLKNKKLNNVFAYLCSITLYSPVIIIISILSTFTSAATKT